MTEKFYSSEGSAGTSLLRDAHIGVEAISAAAALIKQEQWVEAERVLAELQAITAGLAKHVGEKARDAIKLPSPIKATADKRALLLNARFQWVDATPVVTRRQSSGQAKSLAKNTL